METNLLRRILTRSMTKLTDPNAFRAEYDRLEECPPAPGRPDLQHDTMVKLGLCKAAVAHENKHRYCNQYPFDKSLVKVPGVEYINASWIQMPHQGASKYIITGGPMKKGDLEDQSSPDTCEDFWKLVLANSKIIVSLAKTQSGFKGCSAYFPTKKDDEATLTFGSVSVTLLDTQTEDGFVFRLLKVKDDKGHEKVVHHLQYLLWPNYGTPDSLEELACLTQKVDAIRDNLDVTDDKDEAGLVVHCSGGLGRSGTFMTIFFYYRFFKLMMKKGLDEKVKDDLKRHFLRDDAIDLEQTVMTMRQQRHPWMVEGMGQYLVAYKTIMMLLTDLTSD